MTGATQLIESMRNGGLRVTLARRAICDILAGSESDHLSAPEIYERALAATGGIDRSTVYRTLEELARLGLVHHVHLGHQPAVYHLSADRRHHHLVCEHCGDSFSVPLHEIESALAGLKEEHGFVANGLHFAIVGECAKCRSGREA